MLESFIVAFTLLTAVGALSAQASPATREQGFFEWTGMPHTKEVYRARRERTTGEQRLAFEILRVSSDRDGRAAIGLPTEATEWLYLLSYRIGF